MFRKGLLSSTRLPLTLLAILLLLCAQAVSATARAQEESVTAPCLAGLELPEELAELDLAGLQAALQALVEEDPDATVTLLFEGYEVATVRADLLLADEGVLTALLEGQAVKVTIEITDEESLDVITAIEVATAEDCVDTVCAFVLELPAALAGLDVAGLRAALEAMIAEDADATVTISYYGEEAVVRADLLLGLDDPVLEGLLTGDPLLVTLNFQDQPFVILGIALPEGGECEEGGSAPDPKPIPDDKQDDQQGGDGKDDQQGAPKPPAPDDKQDDQQTGTGDDQDDKQGGGDDQQDDQQAGGGAGATVTKTFELTLSGTVPIDRAFGLAYGTLEEFTADEAQDVIFCGQPQAQAGDIVVSRDDCVGNGNVYTYSVNLPQGTELYFTYITAVEGDEEATADFFFGNITFEGPGRAEVLNTDMTNTAWYTFAGGKGDDQQDDQQTGAGDDQQAMVTKTFELTLKGDVPADQVFAVKYGQQQEGDARILVFCGQMESLSDFQGYEAQEECVGDGTVYTRSVKLPQGSILYSTFTRYSPAGEENFFTSNDGEILNTDMTNSAWYDFGGKGEDQQVEMPKALPKTGTGGTAGGFPVSGATALLTLLGAGIFGVIRRR